MRMERGEIGVMVAKMVENGNECLGCVIVVSGGGEGEDDSDSEKVYGVCAQLTRVGAIRQNVWAHHSSLPVCPDTLYTMG